MRKQQDLIDAGYMTIDEFLEKLIPGLSSYMKSNWPGKKDDLHHPEDLIATASIYVEVALHVIGDFGVRSKG